MTLTLKKKFFLVIGGMFVGVVVLYTLFASLIFRRDKITFFNDFNHNVVVNTSAQLRASLEQLRDRVAMAVWTAANANPQGPKLALHHLKDDRIIGVQLFRKVQGAYVDDRPEGGTKMVPLEAAHGFLAEAENSGLSFWSLSQAGIKQFFLATKVDLDVNGQVTNYVAVAQIDPRSILENLQRANLYELYLAKKSGEVVLQLDRETVREGGDLKNHPLLARLEGKNQSGLATFDHDNGKYFGAYASVGLGNLFLVSQANQIEADRGIITLVKNSVLYGGGILTLCFIVGFAFISQFSRRIQLLVMAMHKVQHKDFETRLHIRSGDEMETLANAFNAMTESLKWLRPAETKPPVNEVEDVVREVEKKIEGTKAARFSTPPSAAPATEKVTVDEEMTRDFDLKSARSEVESKRKVIIDDDDDVRSSD